jgi:hypothetical protein
MRARASSTETFCRFLYVRRVPTCEHNVGSQLGCVVVEAMQRSSPQLASGTMCMYDQRVQREAKATEVIAVTQCHDTCVIDSAPCVRTAGGCRTVCDVLREPNGPAGTQHADFVHSAE